MDDTVADTLQHHLNWYKNEFGITLSKEMLRGKKIYDVVLKEHLNTVHSFPHHPDFFRDLNVIENAVEVIYELSKKYEIYFASAAMEYPSSFNAKYDWLKFQTIGFHSVCNNEVVAHSMKITCFCI
ncbi:hypothetical protein ACFQNF_13080 [Iodobacter arcticus]|uniref:Uncharacterized protein n=1 Tax=Iodobacter arcticus TaxID=590593 RepID=A0ABW2QYN0_9NEIS